jgi:hypothetical protein
MGIVVAHDPNAGVVLGAAIQAGQGQYDQRQLEIARQQQQQNVENAMRYQAMANSDLRDRQKLVYAAQQDQQNRQDRGGELQIQQQHRLQDMQFRQGMDQQNFDQQKEVEAARRKHEEAMVWTKLSSEDEMKERTLKRQEDAIDRDNNVFATPQEKEMAKMQLRARAKVGPPVPRNLEARQNFAASIVEYQDPNDPTKPPKRYIMNGGPNAPRFEPMDQTDKSAAEQVKQQREQEKARETLRVKAETDFRKAREEYDKAQAHYRMNRAKEIRTDLNAWRTSNTSTTPDPKTGDKIVKAPTPAQEEEMRTKLSAEYDSSVPFEHPQPKREDYFWFEPKPQPIPGQAMMDSIPVDGPNHQAQPLPPELQQRAGEIEAAIPQPQGNQQAPMQAPPLNMPITPQAQQQGGPRFSIPEQQKPVYNKLAQAVGSPDLLDEHAIAEEAHKSELRGLARNTHNAGETFITELNADVNRLKAIRAKYKDGADFAKRGSEKEKQEAASLAVKVRPYLKSKNK